MNKKNLITLSIFITLVFNSCSPAKEAVKKSLSYNYLNITFLPEQVLQTTSDGVNITIIPVDAKSLNFETVEAAMREGTYEKEFATSIERKRSDLSGYSKVQRAHFSGEERAMKAVDILLRENEIDYETAQTLKSRLFYGFDFGKNGTEIESISKIESFTDIYNPYKVNNKYLSVFRLLFENKSVDIKKINLKDFQIVSGNEQLYPLNSDYFENNLKDEPEKLKNIYRMNMPNELILTPGQKTIKYIAIPAINSNNNDLSVQLIQGSKITQFDFKVQSKSLSKEYKFSPYNIDIELKIDNSEYYWANTIKYSDGVIFSTKNHQFYVSDEKKEVPISAYAIGYSINSTIVKFGKSENISLPSLTKNKIVLKSRDIKVKN